MSSVVGVQSAIRKPAIMENNFEMKSDIIYMIQQSQFSGFPLEEPNDHITNFIEVCDIFKFHNVSDDAVKLQLFPFSLRDRAKSWLNSLPVDSITTWEDLCKKFLSKFFPFEKIVKYRTEIVNFSQFDGETLYEAWTRFKELLRKCPQHGLPRWMQVETFFIGLSASTKTLVNVAAGGSLLQKTELDAFNLLEELSLNNDQYPTEQQILKKKPNTPEMDTMKALTIQIASLTKQLQNNQASVTSAYSQMTACQWYQGAHPSEECQEANPMGNCSTEQSNFVGNFNRPNYQNPNNYYTGACNNHLNLSWKNLNNAMQIPPAPQQGPPLQEQKSNLEDIVAKLGEHTNKFMAETRTTLQNQSAQIRNLETQLSHITNSLNGRPLGVLPSFTKINLKDHCNAITTRKGTIIEPIEKEPRELIAIKGSSNADETTQAMPFNYAPIQAILPHVPFLQQLQNVKLDN